jgi:hypothetical protein
MKTAAATTPRTLTFSQKLDAKLHVARGVMEMGLALVALARGDEKTAQRHVANFSEQALALDKYEAEPLPADEAARARADIQAFRSAPLDSFS